VTPEIADGTRAGILGAVDRIMEHLKLTFVAAKPPPSRVFIEVALMEAEGSGDNDIPYWVFSLRRLPW